MMIGRTFSHYRIEAPLGAGGMGVVFRARDLHLDRDVALKLLPQGLLSDDEVRQRFRREALTLSRLHHAHINVVHDFDVEDGIQFLVMELVPGTTLAHKLKDGSLVESEVLRIGLQIAHALEAAHEAGVLHRDLKPDNIMVTPKGVAKVMDFGLARRFGPASELSSTMAVTAAPALVGTLPYMAPELLMGQEATIRTDLYALGVTLYEMATGQRPYEESQPFALVNAILHQEAQPPRQRRPELSPGLQAIVLKCLARSPENRYVSAKDLIVDLEAPAQGAAAVAAAKNEAARRRSRLLLGSLSMGLTLAALFTVATLLDIGGLRTRMLGTSRIRSIAVLPLQNLSGDPSQEYFADGMTEELTTALAQMQNLNVISRTSAMTYKGSKKTLPQIARELNVQAVVEGAVTRSGDQVRISAQLVDARSDRHLWAQSYERAFSEILALQNQVALAIAEKVQIRVSPDQRTQLAAARTVAPAAHEAYLRGRYYFNLFTAESGRRAIEYFQEALRNDSTLAEAEAGLAATYAQLSGAFMPPAEAMPLAREAARKALALNPNLAEAQSCLAFVRGVYDWQWAEAEAGFKRAIQLNPSEPSAHTSYGYLLTVNRRFEEAARELRRAHEIDPLSQLIGYIQLFPLYESRHYARALQAGQSLLETYPDFPYTRLILGECKFFQGDRQGALQELEEGHAKTNHPVFLAWQALVWGTMGDHEKARRLYRKVQHAADSAYVQPYYVALMHIGLGEKDQAFSWLRKGIGDHSEELVFLQVDPALDPLRSDPRFGALLRQVGFAK